MPLTPALDMGNATLGAAYLGGLAAGHWANPDDIPFASATEATIDPRPFDGLDEYLARFRATYRGLKQANG